MSENDSTSSREKIFDAAVILFAQRGYSAVGVREIAANAGVNISMISYYFGGKVGLLKEIVETFYQEYLEILKHAVDEELPHEKQVQQVIGSIIDFIRARRNLCKVGITEMPYEVQEINELRSDKVKHIKELAFDKYFLKMGFEPDDKLLLPIVGPAFISVLYSNFLLGPIVQNFAGVNLDEQYYERYKEVITNFVSGGLSNVLAKSKSKTGNVS